MNTTMSIFLIVSCLQAWYSLLVLNFLFCQLSNYSVQKCPAKGGFSEKFPDKEAGGEQIDMHMLE